jgi:hypothetical protein
MSWATNYVNPNNLNIPYQGIIADGKLFTEYSPSALLNDKIKESNNIKSNVDYKKFLTNNATIIMNKNFNTAGKITESTNNYPYVFNDVNDNTIPPGYETSLPKNIYLTREQLVSNQVRPLLKK